jgi:hypothetical protein
VTTTTKQSAADDLRAKHGAAEGRKIELESELQEISFDAHTGDAKAAKRLKEISSELIHVDTELKSLTSALAESARREKAATEADGARRKVAAAETARGLLGELESLGQEFDANVLAAVTAAKAIRSKVSELRQLTGAGPSVDSVSMNLKRALLSATMGGPLHSVHLAPSDRVTASQVVGPWMHSFRNWIDAVIETAKAA